MKKALSCLPADVGRLPVLRHGDSGPDRAGAFSHRRSCPMGGSAFPLAVHIGGWLGQRVEMNEKNRLLTVNTQPFWPDSREPGGHPWIGEHVGKWMHAATLAWAYTGDPALREKLDRVAAELIACQEPDGYLGTYVPESVSACYPGADWDVWSHKYNLLGLLTYYQYTGNEAALGACRKMGDLLHRHVSGEEEHPRGRHAHGHGRHKRAGADRAALSRHRRRALFELRPLHRQVVGRAGRAEDHRHAAAGKRVNKTANGKAYEMLSNLVGLCELARATGDRALLQAVVECLAGHRRQAALRDRQRERWRAFPARPRPAQRTRAPVSARRASR